MANSLNRKENQSSSRATFQRLSPAEFPIGSVESRAIARAILDGNRAPQHVIVLEIKELDRFVELAKKLEQVKQSDSSDPTDPPFLMRMKYTGPESSATVEVALPAAVQTRTWSLAWDEVPEEILDRVLKLGPDGRHFAKDPGEVIRGMVSQRVGH